MRREEPIHGTAHLSEIPDKLYFRIGEVARLCQVPAYVLRFWESEFPQLRPNKGGTGQRLYRKRDVEMALRVRTLLKEEGYTIPGARAVLKAEFRQKDPQLSLIADAAPQPAELRRLRDELAALAATLAGPVGKQTAMQAARPIAPLRAPRRVSTRGRPQQIPFESPE